MNILIIDNYDSFTGNLEHLVTMSTGVRPEVLTYGKVTERDLDDRSLIVISAGPGKPADYPGYSMVLRKDIPVLGICLGMQVINEYFGGITTQLPGCIHGRADRVDIDGQSFVVARYHSLYCSRIGEGLNVFGRNAEGVPMAIGHHSRPIIGYQFHPESFLTPEGSHFIELAVNRLCLVAGS